MKKHSDQSSGSSSKENMTAKLDANELLSLGGAEKMVEVQKKTEKDERVFKSAQTSLD